MHGELWSFSNRFIKIHTTKNISTYISTYNRTTRARSWVRFDTFRADQWIQTNTTIASVSDLRFISDSARILMIISASFLRVWKHSLGKKAINAWNYFSLSVGILCLDPLIMADFKMSQRAMYLTWNLWRTIKVRSSWQIPPQHQSTYLGGPESA